MTVGALPVDGATPLPNRGRVAPPRGEDPRPEDASDPADVEDEVDADRPRSPPCKPVCPPAPDCITPATPVRGVGCPPPTARDPRPEDESLLPLSWPSAALTPAPPARKIPAMPFKLSRDGVGEVDELVDAAPAAAACCCCWLAAPPSSPGLVVAANILCLSLCDFVCDKNNFCF